ncbi:MAG: hypothetical protein EXS31_06355 [Pedosphaera sp.]|nr:hypothetical protein [Pedosphaera sp.]
MAEPKPRTFWRRCRIAFRWCRILVLLCFLSIIIGVLYLNRSGLPDFVKRRVEAELRTRGLDVQLGRLRLRGLNELSTRNLLIGEIDQTNGPKIMIQEAQFRLDPDALRKWKLRLESLGLQEARLLWPIPSTNGLTSFLSIDEISTTLKFLDGDRWALDHFDSRFLGTRLHLTASITNASALGTPRGASTGSPAARVDWKKPLNLWAARLQRVQLPTNSILSLAVEGDVLTPSTFEARLRVQTDSADTPWGQITNLKLDARITPTTNTPGVVEARVDLNIGDVITADGEWHLAGNALALKARLIWTNQIVLTANLDWRTTNAETTWVTATNVHLMSATLRNSQNSDTPLQTTLELNADALHSRWVELRTNRLSADVAHSLTNFNAIDGSWRLTALDLATKWGRTAGISLTGRVASPNLSARGPGGSDWGAWSLIDTLALDWECKLQNLSSSELQLESLDCSGLWRAPHLELHRLHAALYGGGLDAAAQLDVATRQTSGKLKFDFDVQRIAPLLPPLSRKWLGQFGWTNPPLVSAEGSVILPSWTNSQPDWRGEVRRTVKLAGKMQAGAGSFRGIGVSTARTTFIFTNETWNLPDLTVTRPEGGATIAYLWHMPTEDYHWGLESTIDPRALAPALQASQVRVLDMLTFSNAPRISGDIWGQWKNPESVGFRAQVNATNLTFKGETCDLLQAFLGFTNRVIQFRDVLIRQKDQEIIVPDARYDLKEQVIIVTNAFSTMDPDLITRVIGPKTREALQPYRFATPPTALVNGVIPTFDTEKADLHFKIEGKNFSYWRFNLPQVSADLHWHADTLLVTNVVASFYKGRLDWSGHFDFTVPVGTDFNFRAQATDADLRMMLADLLPSTNQLSGVVSGQLSITSANSDDWESWQGSGDARVRDGFLMSIPIFGFLSPMLNKIVPSIGDSTAGAATATFVVDRSVVHTSDLEVRSRALRLQYDGKVDMSGNVDARMQAEILRDVWGVGRVVSLALWPITKVFEYQITGTLAKPKSQPVYIPRFLFAPFQPLKTIRDMFNDSESRPAYKEEPKK